jgi:hypothetical protein
MLVNIDLAYDHHHRNEFPSRSTMMRTHAVVAPYSNLNNFEIAQPLVVIWSDSNRPMNFNRGRF